MVYSEKLAIYNDEFCMIFKSNRETDH